MEGLSKSATLTSLSKYNKRPVTDSDNQYPTSAEHLRVSHHFPLPSPREGGTYLQETNGDVPLDGVTCSLLHGLIIMGSHFQ